MGKAITTFEELHVYQEAFRLQQALFQASKRFPSDERFSLTDQMLRASRSVGANVAEAWAKRCYEAHFISKLTDADAELAETRHWLHTAKDCGYMTSEEHTDLVAAIRAIGSMLGKMMNEPHPWLLKRTR